MPKGMVPLADADGKRQVVWIDEWKEKLAKKWVGTGTESLNFDDGSLPTWCIQVLPSAQQDRWKKFFRT